jgi:hypothetical protein
MAGREPRTVGNATAIRPLHYGYCCCLLLLFAASTSRSLRQHAPLALANMEPYRRRRGPGIDHPDFKRPLKVCCFYSPTPACDGGARPWRSREWVHQGRRRGPGVSERIAGRLGRAIARVLLGTNAGAP